ncbi:MAG TPA: DNA recombination protein RmuC [Candidatus Saccharimonadales bacterium]|nr:DNA recombination protein RmuC [Candidatus Saccharimonadales bacterium]
MELGSLALGAVVGALVIGALLLLVLRGRSGGPAGTAETLATVRQAMSAEVGLLQGSLQTSIAELRSGNAQAMADLRTEVHRSLGTTEQQLLTQSGATQRTLGDLGSKLASLGEQSLRIGELAKDVGSLHDLLRAPKLRGGFGELLMERVLEDSLPANAFSIQYGYRDGTRVDAVVRFAGKLVPIDAKFPMESFNALAAATDDADRKLKRRAFLQAVKRHVDAVAKYVAPHEGTIDYAFLYIPAENVYYEAIIRESEDLDLREYCALRRVIPTSPNTLLAYLQLVSAGLRGLAMHERSRELQDGIQHVALEVERFRAQHEQLGRHLDNAAKKYGESLRTLDRATDAIEALGRTPLASGVEQPRLALAPLEALATDEEPTGRFPFALRGDDR